MVLCGRYGWGSGEGTHEQGGKWDFGVEYEPRHRYPCERFQSKHTHPIHHAPTLRHQNTMQNNERAWNSRKHNKKKKQRPILPSMKIAPHSGRIIVLVSTHDGARTLDGEDDGVDDD